MYHRISCLTILSLLMLLFLAGCTEDPVFPEQSLTINVSNLPQLETEGYYELWFSYPEEGTNVKDRNLDHGDQAFFSIGKFIVDANGAPRAPDGRTASFVIPDGINPSLVIDAIITVQTPDTESDDPGPRVLSGNFRGTEEQGIATLELSGSDAFSTSLDNLRGTVRLETSVGATSDQLPTALWFVDAFGNKGLNLLVQPLTSENAEWTYESWLIHEPENGETEYITMGQFDDPGHADNNGAGPGTDTQDIAYPVPGEDFISHGTPLLLNSGDYGVLVTLQPKNITLNHPFLPLLIAKTIPPELPAGQALPLVTPVLQPVVEVIVDR